METGDDRGPFNGPHPLLIRTVIQEVSRYFTPLDKKVYRLVCSQWDEELSKAVRNHSHVVLSNGEKLQQFLNASIFNKNFCSNYFFGPDVTLNLDRDDPHDDNNKKAPSQQLFLSYGPFMKGLYLNLSHSKWSRGDLSSILFKFCPNLEQLSLVGSGVEEGLLPTPSQAEEGSTAICLPVLEKLKCLNVNLICTRMIRNTKLMADLLKLAPKVERISWIKISHDEIRYDRNFQLDLERAWCAKPHENGMTIRDTICDIAIHHKSINLSRLSRMESNMRLSNESLQVLQGRRFPLKYMDISLTLDVEQSSLTSLLASLAGTLTSLKLDFYPSEVGGSHFYGFVFPKLAKLEHLFVQKFSKGLSLGKNFSAAVLPSLKSLTFCETELKALLENEVGMEAGLCHPDRNERVRIFQVICDLSKYPLSDENVRNLALQFPNVRDVRLENFDKSEDDRLAWVRCFQKLDRFGPLSDMGLGGLILLKGENECSKCCKQFMKPSFC